MLSRLRGLKKKEKKSGKKIKKQQQFFADGTFAENIISGYAIRQSAAEESKEPFDIYSSN